MTTRSLWGQVRRLAPHHSRPMVFHLEEGETLEDTVKRLQLPSGGGTESWFAKHAPGLAFIPRPCETPEEWLRLYAPKDERLPRSR
jgi:hypothetical protein